jgi:GntR family negative regulator for fad regulon and positive regulator of fabA
MNHTQDQPLRPAQFAEDRLIRFILDNTFPPNANLPAERELARQIGVTRPTLRETMQRLARDGWIRIRHGKPTIVNDYWAQGGLGMLGTMARYAEFLPLNFIENLLEVRLSILPVCSRAAAENAPMALQRHLREAPDLDAPAETFASFDWRLQELMVRHSGNCIFPLILNDFKEIYHRLASDYFRFQATRKSSARYYLQLNSALPDHAAEVERVVTAVMQESITLWLKINKFSRNASARTVGEVSQG